MALDGGKIECAAILDGDGSEPLQHLRGKEWDFWFEASGKIRWLHPQNHTMFAKAETTEPGKVGCQATTYSRRAFRIDALPSGSHVCVLTGQGRYAELTILDTVANSSNKPSQLTYVLWE